MAGQFAFESLLVRVRTTLEANGIRNQLLGVAVSGGADSVALLHLLERLRSSLGIELFVAHFDHRLRPESAADADWVSHQCAQLSLPCVVGQPGTAAPESHVEAWARRERYAFLVRIAEERQCRWISVAHTADDQAETVLHHIFRGTGLAGLAGMPGERRLSETVRLIRPCLGVRRVMLRSFLDSIGAGFREDPSNQDLRFQRNSIRHAVLPVIEREFGRDPVGALVRLADQARESSEVLRHRAARILKSAELESTSNRVHLAAAAFQNIPGVLVQEAAVLLWTRQNWPRREMTQASWRRAAALFQGETQSDQWSGGIRGQRRGKLIVLERSEASL